MAAIDYGCNFKIDNHMFEHDWERMEDAEMMSWIPEAAYDEDGNKYTIKGNYYCYLGDREFFLCFWKCYFLIVSGDKVLDVYDLRFKSEHLIRNDIDIYVRRLSDEYHTENYCSDFEESDFKTKTEWLRYNKRSHKIGKVKIPSSKFLADWEYKGHKYSVMYGYGIDTLETMERVYSEGHYDFTEADMTEIRKWFNE